jgi:GH18 family chitinase
MSKILVFDKDQWVGYDDEETLNFKRAWAKKNCMRGTMIWSIDQGLEKYEYEDNVVLNKLPPVPDRSPTNNRPAISISGQGHG